MKYLFTALAIVLALKFGYTYLGSDDFQRYGDEHNATWTCYVNNFMGHFALTMSNYDDALHSFIPVLKRCPKTPMAEEAMFRIAICLESTGHRPEAAGDRWRAARP